MAFNPFQWKPDVDAALDDVQRFRSYVQERLGSGLRLAEGAAREAGEFVTPRPLLETAVASSPLLSGPRHLRRQFDVARGRRTPPEGITGAFRETVGPLFEPVLTERAVAPVRRIPLVGESTANIVEGLTSPVGLLGLAAAPVATLGSAGASIAAGSLGRPLGRLVAGERGATIGGFAGELAGSFVTPQGVRSLARGPRGLPRPTLALADEAARDLTPDVTPPRIEPADVARELERTGDAVEDAQRLLRDLQRHVRETWTRWEQQPDLRRTVLPVNVEAAYERLRQQRLRELAAGVREAVTGYEPQPPRPVTLRGGLDAGIERIRQRRLRELGAGVREAVTGYEPQPPRPVTLRTGFESGIERIRQRGLRELGAGVREAVTGYEPPRTDVPTVLRRGLQEDLERKLRRSVQQAWTQYGPREKGPIILGDSSVNLTARQLPEKPTWWEQVKREFVRPALASLERQGPAGRELAQKLRTVREEAELAAAPLVRRLREAVRAIPKEDYEHAVDVVEGRAVPRNDAVARFAEVWSEVRDRIARDAQEAGVLVVDRSGRYRPFTPLPDYFPHVYDTDDLKRLLRDEQRLQQMVRNGQARNVAEARNIVYRYLQRHAVPRFGNLERARELNAPGYLKDPRLTIDHVINAYERIAATRHLGARNEAANALINRIAVEGGDDALARDVLDLFQGRGERNRRLERIFGVVRNVQVPLRLALSPLSQFAQISATAMRAGPRATVQGIARSLTREGREFAQDASLATQEVQNVARLMDGDARLAQRFLDFIQFFRTDRIQRYIAVNAGAAHAENLARQIPVRAGPRETLAERELRAMGIDLAKVRQRLARGEAPLTREDLLRAGRRIEEATQFRGHAEEFPLFWDSPIGRTFVQFKRFSYNQTRVINYALQEFRRGNPGPLLTFLLVGTVMGEAILTARSAITGRERPGLDEGMRGVLLRLTDDALYGANMGILADALMAFRYSRDAGDILEWFGGPTAGTVAELSTVAIPLREGNVEQAARAALREVPVVGRRLQRGLLPTEAQEREAFLERYGDVLEPYQEAPEEVFRGLRAQGYFQGADSIEAWKEREVRRLRKTYGMPAWQAERLVERRPEYQLYQFRLSTTRQLLRRQNPELDRLLLEQGQVEAPVTAVEDAGPPRLFQRRSRRRGGRRQQAALTGSATR